MPYETVNVEFNLGAWLHWISGALNVKSSDFHFGTCSSITSIITLFPPIPAEAQVRGARLYSHVLHSTTAAGFIYEHSI